MRGRGGISRRGVLGLAAGFAALPLTRAQASGNSAPPEDVIGHAASLLGLPLPPAIPYEAADMTPMARSFYAESKRVRNDRIKRDLGVALHYPTYREGLAALLSGETAGG